VEQVEEHLGLGDVDLIAEADELAHPYLVAGEVVDGRHAEGAALGHDGDAPGHGARGRDHHVPHAQGLGLGQKQHVHAGVGVVDAQAVGAQDPDPRALGNGLHASLELALAHLAEAGADDGRRLHALLRRVLHDPGNDPGRDDHDDELHVSHDLREGGVAPVSQDGVLVGIDGVQLSPEQPPPLVIDEVPEDHMARLSSSPRSPHHGDGLRLEKNIHPFNDRCLILGHLRLGQIWRPQ